MGYTEDVNTEETEESNIDKEAEASMAILLIDGSGSIYDRVPLDSHFSKKFNCREYKLGKSITQFSFRLIIMKRTLTVQS